MKATGSPTLPLLALSIPLVFAVVAPGGALAETVGFVETAGVRFALCGEPYYFSGANYWYGLSLASAGPGGDRERLDRELELLASVGVTNLRVMAGSEGPDTEPWRMVPSLQVAPGVYDPVVLDGLDYLLFALAERNLRAVMCLTNFWHWSGGTAQYVRWNGGGPIPYPPPEPGGDWNAFQDYSSDFWSNAGAKQDLRDHIAFLASRVNPYTGRAYRDEPAIFAWELANEPRGFHNNAAAFNLWIDETAACVKSLDPNHLVTTGCEGDTPWPSWNGLDFVLNHDGSNIDYATIHVWPQNWGWYDPANAATFPAAEANARAYFRAHAAEAALLGKPLVLEEFGLARDGGSFDPSATTAWRDSFLVAMYDQVLESASAGGPAGGDNFWAWAGEGRPVPPFGGYWSPGDPWTGDPPHEQQGWYGVYDADSSTLARVSAHAAEMRSLIPTSVGGAPARGTPSGGLRLHRGSPNPFRESAGLSFDLDRAAPVRVRIYDARGALVRVLLPPAVLPAGGCRIEWDARDDLGRPAPSGLYIYWIETGVDRATGKLTLLR